MFITLVGMSGCGKSKWGKKLRSELGFNLYSCDDIIEEHLKAEIKTDLQHTIQAEKQQDKNNTFSKKTNEFPTIKHGTLLLAEWMGTPFDSRYAKNKERYLHFENEALLQAISAIELAMQKPNLQDRPNIIIDTTGSVIYLNQKTLSVLKSLSIIIYLETPSAAYDHLCRRYLNRPKPIIWDQSFQPKPGENKQTTLARCLKDLIKNRTNEYKNLAHVCLGFDDHNAMTMHSSEFIEKITTALNKK